MLGCLFHAPWLKASLSFIHAFVLEIAVWQVLGAGERRLGLDNERKKQERGEIRPASGTLEMLNPQDRLSSAPFTEGT